MLTCESKINPNSAPVPLYGEELKKLGDFTALQGIEVGFDSGESLRLGGRESKLTEAQKKQFEKPCGTK